MRDKNRLDEFYEQVRDIHKRYFSDWRFGQLCNNFFGWIATTKKRDIFFPEEDKMIEYLKEFASIYGE